MNKLTPLDLALWTALPMAHTSRMEGRIAMILDKTRRRTLPRRAFVLGAALTAAAIVPLAMLRPTAKAQSAPRTAADTPFGSSRGEGSSMNVVLADQYFREAQAISDRDNGKLWGVPLHGPMLFVDPQTRRVVANQADKEGLLAKNKNVFVGTLPAEVNIANTTMDWAGVKWTMIMWPLPDNRDDRAVLMAHELWHHVQDKIGFPASGAANNHLDSRAGRVWLQLEWRALAAALTSQGTPRRQAAADALLFRAYRRSLFPNAASEEREMEMHEGLAEYTGVKLSGAPDLNQYWVSNNLKEATQRQTFVRSFAYASGPAYGILLDETGLDWRHGLTKDDDLGTMLQKRLTINLPASLKTTVQLRSKNYDGEALQVSEAERENKRLTLLGRYRSQLVDGPRLLIPLKKMSMQFNPGNILPLDALGTVYPNIRVVCPWGILTVTNGALINPTFSEVYVSAPSSHSASSAKGDGWTLALNPGWTIAEGERKGDAVVKEL